MVYLKSNTMTHTYKITGMSCNGCRTKVEKTLNDIDGISAVVTLEPPIATITMEKHIPTEQLQIALSSAGKYTIEMINHQQTADGKESSTEVKSCCATHDTKNTVIKPFAKNSSGKYYCPMHCEGDKLYDKPGSCPVCGMNLEKVPELTTSKTEYTCPMHLEIIRDAPGACPICGMDLVPIVTTVSEEDTTYKELWKKMKVALIFTIPVFLIAMLEMIPALHFTSIMPQIAWNWLQFALSLPVVFYACWMFFQRAWTSIRTMNLNMFTLIGIGAGAAFIFSVIAMLFPSVFPEEFKGHNGTVSIYFESVTVILTLVLLGQLLEARAHSQTNGAIKALLKLAPTEATLVVGGKDKIIAIDDIKKDD